MFWRDFIGYLFYIPVYEYILKNLKKLQIKENSTKIFNNNDFNLLLSGGLAGSLSWWLICPFELLKNRLQSFQNIQNQQNWREIMLKIFYEGKIKGGGHLFYGLTAFYRGGTLLALRAFPVNSCIFYVHSKCLELF
ncbi:hypothetical protein Mgra_00006250 [Meloidogyne graminicola]|uniref:Mitochondrial carrier protein n=1 Tax=Meloidogyne graminicola TaxID=189291 RepID=A0A8S9ZLW9_9BILA|nr:hypothetical protein Mgra_00006250 [Meloidogyne graminicola]